MILFHNHHPFSHPLLMEELAKYQIVQSCLVPSTPQVMNQSPDMNKIIKMSDNKTVLYDNNVQF